MASHIFFVVIFLSSFHSEFSWCFRETDCEGDSPRALGLNVVSKRNHSGQWVTSFTAYKGDTKDNENDDISLDLNQQVAHCNGTKTLVIRGVISEALSKDIRGVDAKPTKLLFHPKCGSNVAVINKGRTLQKINLDEALYSVAFTNRPLMDEEIFEVTLDKKNNKFGNSLGIGVTSFPPTEISIPKHINHFPLPSWAMYHSHLYHNGSEFMKNYGKNLDALVVGNRVGVMRSSTGTLHYYVNGVDQGPAASNIPNPVYGLLELFHDAAMATVVNSS